MLPPGACIIKLITAVIYGFCDKLKCLTLNTRLGWKGLPGTNKLETEITAVISFMIQVPGGRIWQLTYPK